MQKFKEVLIPEHITLEKDIVVCDICGKDIDHETGKSCMPVLLRDVEISYEHGESWPDDNTIYYFKPDICSECFREKVYPHIMSLIKLDSTPWTTWLGKEKHDCINELP